VLCSYFVTEAILSVRPDRHHHHHQNAKGTARAIRRRSSAD